MARPGIGGPSLVLLIPISETKSASRSPHSVQRNSRADREPACRSLLDDLACLLDNLVGALEHRLRHREAKRLGGFKVDDQLEGRRLLDRQIGGFGALEDLSRVSTDEAKGISEAWSIADQA